MISGRRSAIRATALLAGAATLAAGHARAQTAAGDDTFARIERTKTLRIAAIVGTEPYYHKDIVSGAWSGFCVSMGQDLAKSMGAALQIEESSWGNSVLDLQSGKIDVMFGLSPTPQRALVVEFSRPLLENTFTAITRPGLPAAAWSDLDKPSVRVAVDLGSTHDLFARRVLPHATLVALPTPDEAVLAVQSGRADCVIQVIMLALVTIKKNPRAGHLAIPTPVMQQPTCVGVRADPGARFLTYVDNWLDYNRSLGVVRDWITASLALVGVTPADVPANVQL